LKIKLKGHHFDTIEVIGAESQAVLNTLTEYDFQDAHKSGRNARNSAYAQKGTTSRVMVANSPNASFSQVAAPVPEIMDTTSSSINHVTDFIDI
jgi:hypothetical protein